jgi:hypothetical protein
MTVKDNGNLLIDGETVVWSGRPAQGLLFTSRDWLLIPFSFIWCGFAIFWETSVLQTNAPLFMKLFGAAFVLIGLYFVAGRFLLDAWVRSGTQYAVTRKRVLIARSWPYRQVYRIEPQSLARNEPSGKRKRPRHYSFWSAHTLFGTRLRVSNLDSVARSRAGVPRHRKRPQRV